MNPYALPFAVIAGSALVLMALSGLPAVRDWLDEANDATRPDDADSTAPETEDRK